MSAAGYKTIMLLWSHRFQGCGKTKAEVIPQTAEIEDVANRAVLEMKKKKTKDRAQEKNL